MLAQAFPETTERPSATDAAPLRAGNGRWWALEVRVACSLAQLDKLLSLCDDVGQLPLSLGTLTFGAALEGVGNPHALPRSTRRTIRLSRLPLALSGAPAVLATVLGRMGWSGLTAARQLPRADGTLRADVVEFEATLPPDASRKGSIVFLGPKGRGLGVAQYAVRMPVLPNSAAMAAAMRPAEAPQASPAASGGQPKKRQRRRRRKAATAGEASAQPGGGRGDGAQAGPPAQQALSVSQSAAAAAGPSVSGRKRPASQPASARKTPPKQLSAAPGSDAEQGSARHFLISLSGTPTRSHPLNRGAG